MKRKQKVVYIIGALKNRKIMHLAVRLRKAIPGVEFFCGWISAGPEADSFLKEHCKIRGLSYKETLATREAQNTFRFDLDNINRADMGILVMPAGRSAHLELGYVIGQGKPGYILFDREPDRVDIMYNFATDVFFTESELFQTIKKI